MTLTPAYGRDYKSKKAALADWNANKDFVINDISSPHNGRNVNKADAERAGLTHLMIRYNKLTQIAPIK